MMQSVKLDSEPMGKFDASSDDLGANLLILRREISEETSSPCFWGTYAKEQRSYDTDDASSDAQDKAV